MLKFIKSFLNFKLY